MRRIWRSCLGRGIEMEKKRGIETWGRREKREERRERCATEERQKKREKRVRTLGWAYGS